MDGYKIGEAVVGELLWLGVALFAVGAVVGGVLVWIF